MERQGFRFTLTEFGGALGDLGTLLPLLIALIAINGLHPTPVLLLVGVSYIGAGLFYRLPMPVQPLKAASAIAVSLRVSPALLSATGLLMAVILMGLAATGLVKALYRLFPRGVIRGIQLGVGLLLLRAGFRLMMNPTPLPEGGTPLPGAVANLAVAVMAVALLLFFLKSRRLPASLAVIGFGVGMGLFDGPLRVAPQAASFAFFSLPHPEDISSALFLLVLPQLPLTLGNSVFAAADAAHSYYGQAAKRVTPRNLLYSVGVMNLIAGVTGGMPQCHGSGGLTAHYRLGARTGGAGIMIGAIFVLLALSLGRDVLAYLSLIPYPVLGVMLGFVGFQHALLARQFQGRAELAVIITIGVVTLLTRHLGIGFASGIVLHYLLRFINLGNRPSP